jgi:hypothetical protein
MLQYVGFACWRAGLAAVKLDNKDHDKFQGQQKFTVQQYISQQLKIAVGNMLHDLRKGSQRQHDPANNGNNDSAIYSSSSDEKGCAQQSYAQLLLTERCGSTRSLHMPISTSDVTGSEMQELQLVPEEVDTGVMWVHDGRHDHRLGCCNQGKQILQAWAAFHTSQLVPCSRQSSTARSQICIRCTITTLHHPAVQADLRSSRVPLQQQTGQCPPC